MPSTGDVVAVRATGPAWWSLDCLFVELSGIADRGPLVAEGLLPAGASPPLHVHDHLDDSFYVLEGQLVVRCGDDVQLAAPGSWVPFPRGVPHTFRVIGGPARILTIHGNDSFLSAVRAVGRLTESRVLPASGDGPSPETLTEVFSRHGVTNVGPPMSEEEAQRFLSVLSV